ncbi:ABC transporter permease [Tianweitania sp.]|uniref:ABC transporter permease n=1 Tax=Tianweitania sp. TaxID=2021634 RepID=UPI00289EA3CE|nr:ABC transporter permease [Tianweitania sp.]
MRALSWQCLTAVLLLLAALFQLPLANVPIAMTAPAVAWTTLILVYGFLIAGIVIDTFVRARLWRGIALFFCAHLATVFLFTLISDENGLARPGFYVVLAACWLLAWRCVAVLSGLQPRSRAGRIILALIIPAIFGAWILIIWEAVTRGLGIPFILLPPPSAIFAKLASSLSVIAADVNQTILKSVLAGYIMGCASGFVAAIIADRFPFMRRGLLPIGNLVSALPMIGIAPIMVMWFGFDWQSKAAVVVIMTFFPMLVNTVAGLAVTSTMERDLMRTYAAGYWQTLFKLRLPAAGPFVFNALKINSTLALIGAIVAEFFGTPVVGMGFRISTEVGRMNVDMVWAEIAVAAIIGSLFYGGVALVERAVTFWHPSFRTGKA